MLDSSSSAPITPFVVLFAYMIVYAIAFGVWNRRRAARRPNAATASANEMIRYWLPFLIVYQMCAWIGVAILVVATALTTELFRGPGGQAPLLGFLLGLILVPIGFAVFDVIWLRRVRAGHQGAPFGR